MTLQAAISLYKEHFLERRGLDDELYKWEIVTKYKGTPNPEAADIIDQICAFNFNNLIYGSQRTAFRKLAKLQTEGYKNAMRFLFDVSVNLTVRVTSFINTW